MPKVIPVPDALSKPFWDAVNEKRLVCSTAPPAASSSIHRNRLAGSADPPHNWRGKRPAGKAILPPILLLRTAGSTGACLISPTIWR